MNRKRGILLLVVGTVVAVVGLHLGLLYYESQLAAGCEPTLSVNFEDETEVDSEVLEFSNLSVEQQREFEQAVAGENPEIDSSDWHGKRFIKYNDRIYETAVAVC